MARKKDPMGIYEIAVCALPIVAAVGRIGVEQEANARNMGVLAAVAAFGLSALLGQKWAMAAAPFIFLAAMGELIVFSVLTAGPIYNFALAGMMVWSAHELSVDKEMRAGLLKRAR